MIATLFMAPIRVHTKRLRRRGTDRVGKKKITTLAISRPPYGSYHKECYSHATILSYRFSSHPVFFLLVASYVPCRFWGLPS